MMDSSRMMVAYCISERGGKSYWSRIGVAFRNSDASVNVKLECLPVNGEIHLRVYQPGPTGEELPQGFSDQVLENLKWLILATQTPEEKKALMQRVRKLFG